MHRATNPFVAGKYLLNRNIEQYQFFRRLDKVPAFFILARLLQNKRCGCFEGSCLVQMSFGGFAQAQPPLYDPIE